MKIKRMKKYIGGQLGYDNLISPKSNLLKNTQLFTNGRSALFFILKNIKSKINKVYVPSYLCESILQPIKKLGIKFIFYEIRNNLNFKIPKEKKSAIIILNYFGLENRSVENISNDYKKNIYYIYDCTHNIFNKYDNFKVFNKKNIFRFASIRKYIPFPVGAICNLDYVNLKKIKKKNKKILKKFNKLIDRNKYFNNSKKNIFYENQLLNEQDRYKLYENRTIFKNKLPEDIENKIKKYNLKRILFIRNNNYNFLKKKLEKKVKIVSKNTCYPLYLTIFLIKDNKKKVFNYLSKQGIFSVNLWPIPKEVNRNNFKYTFALNKMLISFPIDHRYNLKDMEYMASNILKSLKL